jgi:hypothetical protein
MTMLEDAVTQATPGTTTPSLATLKVGRLNTASLRKIIEPEETFDFGAMTKGQVIPDQLLSVADLDLDLTAEQKARLSREETAAMLSAGVAFEAILMAGFAWQVAVTPDITDPRTMYMLHEIGEETRHSRAFVRVVQELDPQAKNPLDKGIPRYIQQKFLPILIKSPALLATMILAGEELPDLLQKLASEHPETDEVLAAVNKYHRMEEARHLAFARLTVGELYKNAGWRERLRIKRVAPVMIGGLFDTFIHPGVYATVDLPTWKTWKAAKNTPARKAIKYAASRPILKALVDGGVFAKGSIPKGWRKLCGVDANGTPLPGTPTLASVGLA